MPRSRSSVLGDRTYGKKTVLEIRQKKIFFRRQMLHAESLGFVHPLTGVQMEFTRGLPEDMEEKIRELREKAEKTLGANFDIREFHEVILGQGTVTLAILEERVNHYIEKNK